MPEHPHVPTATGGPSEVYMVSLCGCLGAALLDAFSPLVATVTAGRTTLCGPIEDQAALYGVLAKIQNYGLELDEITHVSALPGEEPDRP